MSFITLYVANHFEILTDILCELVYVSTSISESIIVESVYLEFPISINHKDTMADLVELDFVVILGMDLIHAYYPSIVFKTRVVKFQIPNYLVIEWNSISAVPKGNFYFVL